MQKNEDIKIKNKNIRNLSYKCNALISKNQNLSNNIENNVSLFNIVNSLPNNYNIESYNQKNSGNSASGFMDKRISINQITKNQEIKVVSFVILIL